MRSRGARSAAGAAIAAILLGGGQPASAETGSLEAPPVDDAANFGGLPEAEGRAVVFNHCSICHSMKLVLQQRLSRERWDQTLDWMVEEQGMAEPGPETRETILDYLAEQLNPDVPR